jgi:ferritin-like metal-binding protein YciE
MDERLNTTKGEQPMSLDSLREVYVEDLKDIYSAETQLTKALPKMAKAASTPQLKQAFEQHLAVTRVQIERLEQIFQKMGEKPTGKKCMGMEGLIKEGQEVIEEKENPYATDAALIVAAQKVEHYEMAAYGSVRTFATLLGESQAARLLERTLNEEKKTDELLTKLAERNINQAAKAAEMEEDEDDSSSSRSGRGGKSSKSTSKSSSRSKSGGSKSRSSKSGGSSRSAKSSSSRSSTSASKSASSRGSTGRSGSSAKSSSSSRSSSSGKKKSAGSSRGGSKGSSGGNGSSSSSNITTDREEIRQWVESRGGHPACVKGTGARGDTGLLRIDYPGYSGGDTLEEISWDEFFQKFDEEKLAFLYQNETSDGKQSRFSKLVSRNSK